METQFYKSALFSSQEDNSLKSLKPYFKITILVFIYTNLEQLYLV